MKKNPEPRQITWLCGPEIVLVEEVVNHVCTFIGPEPWNRADLVAGDDSERAIWAALDQHPLGTSARVVIVRHAELLKDWDRWIQWVKDRSRNPRTYVIMVSAELAVPKTDPTREERRNGAKSEPQPHIACIGTKGHVVECKPFTTATVQRSLEWVKSKVHMRDGVAKHLLERSNWDLRLVRDTCLKLSVFPGEITLAVVNALLAEQPRDTFTDALLALDRKTALLAAASIPTSEIGKVIGLLDSSLDTAGMIHDMQVEHRSPSEMAKALGAQAFLLTPLLRICKHYDAKRRLAIRKVLALADEAYRNGQTVGVLEVIVTFW